MKKALYMMLLAVELAAGFGLLALVTDGAVTRTYSWITIAVWAILLGLMLVKLKKAADENGKYKIKIAIALVMLIPFVGAFCGFSRFLIIMMKAVL